MRLIISSLAIVSVLFILMSVRVAADDRAQELVRQARAAIGGEQVLDTVRSLSLVGKLRRDDRAGEIKLDFLLPDRFKRTETINLIADIETTFTSALNGNQAWNDSSTNNTGGGSVRVNAHAIRPADGPQGQAARGQQLRFEYARQLIALFLTSNSAFPVEFTYAGEAQSKDGRADVLDAKGPDGFQVRLFLDKATHRPLMMKYRGMIPRTSVNTQTAQTRSQQDLEKIIKDAKEGRGQMREAARQEGDLEVYLSDYRAVNGVMLPHRISKSMNGKLGEEWEIKKYKINPPLTAQDFEKK